MKKILISVIAMLLPLMASAIQNYDAYIDGIYYNLDSSTKTAEVTYLYGYLAEHESTYSGNIIIPSEVTYDDVSYSVTSIGNSAFQYSNLVSITIPNSVTTIGNSAFSGSGLKSIIIPNSVTTIGSMAFQGCKSLTSAIIGNSVKGIGEYAFGDCSGLTSITIPNSVTSIGYGAFCDASLRSITFYGRPTIMDMAFHHCYFNNIYCYSETSPSLIGGDAFDICNATLYVPANAIDTYKMTWGGYNIKALGSTLDNDVISGKLGVVSYTYNIVTHTLTVSGAPGYDPVQAEPSPWKFPFCDEIFSLIIDQGVTDIGEYSFFDFSSLTSVIIPNSVTTIWNHAFANCCNITSLSISNSVTSIRYSAFSGCSGLTTIMSEIETPFALDEYAFDNDIYLSATLIVPSGKKSAYQSTAGWKKFSNIVEVDSYTFEENGVNYRISGENTVSVVSNNTKYSGDIVIPDQLSYMGTTYSVTSIDNGAFSGCGDLTSIKVGNKVTKIGDDAFRGCRGLTSITLGSGLASIGHESFVSCLDVTNILSLNDTPPDYQHLNITFDFTKCVLWVPRGKLNAYKEAGSWAYFNIREIIDGDVNLDGEVNKIDLDAATDFIMDKEPEIIYESLADLNGDTKVDAADVVKLVTIKNLQEGLSMDWQTKYSNQVISSFSCTLNNDGDKAIQLTKCELFCNQSLVSSANFKVTLASGGSKKCSFDELASYSTKTGFSVVWYYTYNGESYTYRCDLSE